MARRYDSEDVVAQRHKNAIIVERWVPLLNIQCLKNSAEGEKRFKILIIFLINS